MINEFAWKVGGQQGEGIESTGEIFSKALSRKGYFLYSYRHFSSRIKGGHTNNLVHVSTNEVSTIPKHVDILVAFDQETIDLNHHEVPGNGIIIADEQFKPTLPTERGHLYAVPLTKIAREHGTKLMKNMVAIGATCAAINLETSIFEALIHELFASKGMDIVENNIAAMNDGYTCMKEKLEADKKALAIDQADGKARMLMTGNESIALGALTGGVKLMFAYPITPASDIMEYLIDKLPEVGGTVIQTEDEIAAVTMAIGANYSGTRAFTASSGPGLSLMMEAIGLSGMTETPLVVVNTQRGGPSTGLPTKHEQSDLMSMIYGNHGEIPKIVLAPHSIEAAFYDTIEAFNLAEEYQCPVILLSDLQLSLAKQTVSPFDYSKVELRRGNLTIEKDGLSGEKDDLFKRYELTESGISPRVIPGIKHGIHHVTGVEHTEIGRPNEGKENRTLQMDKRFRKLTGVVDRFPDPVHIHAPHEEPDIVMIGFNSTYGAIKEAIALHEEDGHKVNHLHVRLLHPFPKDVVLPYIEKAKHVVIVENNATGQLTQLLKMNCSSHHKIKSILKYDGDPFRPDEVFQQSKELLVYDSINV